MGCSQPCTSSLACPAFAHLLACFAFGGGFPKGCGCAPATALVACYQAPATEAPRQRDARFAHRVTQPAPGGPSRPERYRSQANGEGGMVTRGPGYQLPSLALGHTQAVTLDTVRLQPEAGE